ncbi:MAG: ATP-binding protein, partial [Lachnospira sp.]|nr:ATP-binding protein [Lachnospira sp.]
GAEYIKEELRETAVYNTILSYIAKGYYKLNELHALTGFGRDKISVYLKNLMEREIVEKLYSYDADGNEYTRKGLYRIKSGFTEFWYKYIYGREYQLELLQSEDFYDIYIADTISDFPKETFIKAGMEYVQYLDCHNQLPVKIDRRGRWWGKNGDIDIIACDIDKKYVVGSCNWQKDVFTFTMFEELVYNVNLAGIGRDYIYLFSKGTFDEELTAYAKDNDNIKLIGLIDM